MGEIRHLVLRMRIAKGGDSFAVVNDRISQLSVPRILQEMRHLQNLEYVTLLM